MLLKSDRLADGSTVAAVHRAEGLTYADLDDGRQLVLRDWQILKVYRPESTPDRPEPSSKSLFE